MATNDELLANVRHLEQQLEEIKDILRERDKAHKRPLAYRIVKTLKLIFLGL